MRPGPVLLLGQSRGGILSVAYAGLHPEKVRGVINFVGGWVGDGCRNAIAINRALMNRGARFPRPMLWLYGENDPFYALDHTRGNFEAFRAAGGRGRFFGSGCRAATVMASCSSRACGRPKSTAISAR